MQVEAIVQRSAGLDVHKKIIVVTILLEQPDGTVNEETREYGTTYKACEQLSDWLLSHDIQLSVMESTGIYWKNIYAALEKKGLPVSVVNARHVKQVPGRKTDVKDSQWLARLARYGLLRGSFIPPKDLRELRIIARYRTKLKGMMASEKNRLHKTLDDAGVRLGNVVSDISGVTATEIIAGLVEGKSIDELLDCTRTQLKKKKSELRAELEGELSARHLFLLKKLQKHIAYVENELRDIDDYLFTAMQPYQKQWEILQTIPGIDAVGAALLIIEMGVDMEQFGSREQCCSWAGMCPGNNESAGKRKSGKTPKGSKQLRYLLCEAANAASKTECQFKHKYKSLMIRRGHKKAIVAVGHKMLRVIFSRLKTGEMYQDPVIDYEALVVKKNAPRWIRMLRKHPQM
ncbi:IS110 family transposase [Legionella pneumophila]|uniref:IS110 family transposase n=1 Tax=Legionella pneumophila TaxID=446 RepID=UPI0039C3B0ED